ncbi:MAG: ClbS/DfsB family four-helix bundle protein [Peptococcaceae bacterium]|nr:ClbS/DfsB family four-helix bundle protein [Peptococcaceae bacterium]
MPRPTTKAELIVAANDQWAKMWRLLDSIPGGAQSVVFRFNNDPMLRKSHGEVMSLIESLTDEELFEKQHFSWTGTTNIGSYCISVTASHYDWAMRKIKLHRKTVT